jgi:hypothetical protein
MKKCRRCNIEKPFSEYYKHKEMFDGYLNICKECTKKRVGKHRVENIDRIREYDRTRGECSHRKKANSKRTKEIRKTYPKLYFAQTKIGNSLRDGKIFKPEICSWCGSNHDQIEGHHEDYNLPMHVVWLCSPCHKILHLGDSKESKRMRLKIKIPQQE